MIPIHAYEGQRVGVLGLGRSGLATAAALKAGGAEPVCWDDNEVSRLTVTEFEVADISREREAADLAALIVSPGIPHLYPEPHKAVIRAQANDIPVDNDVGLFFAAMLEHEVDDDPEPKIIAVTGSNGKSTTTALIHHILKQAGKRTQMGGNIGRGVLDIDPPEDGGVVVLELSSYQTELARALTPDVAVFTNLSPDHLDRHGGLGGYFAAKRRLFAEGGPDRAVIGVDEAEGAYLAGQLSEGAVDDRVIRISVTQKLSGPGWSVFARKGFLSEYRKTRQAGSIDLRKIKGLPGVHNHQNACAAYAACRTLGLSPRVIEAGFLSFDGLPHRSQIIAEKDGVSFVNDSKATNVDAVYYALLSVEQPIIWVAGGQDKGNDYEQIKALVAQKVKAIVCLGLDNTKIRAVFGPIVKTIIETQTCPAAIEQASQLAQANEVVLLSPACASFDLFDNFAQRGELFKKAVLDMKKQ